MDTIERIKNQIEKNNVILYMKGNPHFPMCGFSSQVVTILNNLNADYRFVNILEEPEIREKAKEFSDWPTFPQLYVKGQFVGGCDIVTEMYKDGSLQKTLSAADAVIENPLFEPAAE